MATLTVMIMYNTDACIDHSILAATWNEQVIIHGANAPCSSVSFVVVSLLNRWWSSLPQRVSVVWSLPSGDGQ